MFDKMMAAVFCKADRQHKDNLVNLAKILDSSARILLDMAKALLGARANDTDPLGSGSKKWSKLWPEPGESRTDNLAEVIESYPRVHRIAMIILGAFTFRSWKSTDSLLTALDVLRQLYASAERKLPTGVPTAFLAPVWRKLIGPGPVVDRCTWEVAVVMTLRDRLRAEDIWVEGSRAFDDFLLPPAAFAAKQKAVELGLAVPDRFEAWRDERLETLERPLSSSGSSVTNVQASAHQRILFVAALYRVHFARVGAISRRLRTPRRIVGRANKRPRRVALSYELADRSQRRPPLK